MLKTDKDEHYQDLEQLINRKVQLTNSLTINKQYLNNNVIQPSISQSRFPLPWMSNDLEFTDQFNKLIVTFQTQIQQFNINYIEKKLTKLTIDINNKLNFMKNIDSDAVEKCKVLESTITNKLLPSLTKSTEKVNRLIVAANVPNSSHSTHIHPSTARTVPTTSFNGTTTNTIHRNNFSQHLQHRNNNNNNNNNTYNNAPFNINRSYSTRQRYYNPYDPIHNNQSANSNQSNHRNQRPLRPQF